jgi:hypothetical protein
MQFMSTLAIAKDQQQPCLSFGLSPYCANRIDQWNSLSNQALVWPSGGRYCDKHHAGLMRPALNPQRFGPLPVCCNSMQILIIHG